MPDNELERLLAERAAQTEATVAYSVVALDGSAAIRVRADLSLPTASTYKVYLLAALYAADAAGRLSLDSKITYSKDDCTLGSGVMKLFAAGASLTLRDLARLMIVVSDNVATNLITRALGGPEAANAAVHALPIELEQTAIRSYISLEAFGADAMPLSSPNDFTALLSAIFEKRCTGSIAHDEEIYWVLRRQQLRSMIPRYLPCSEYAEEFGVEEHYRCGTKSGSMPGVRADVGIVETPARSWAMAVMVQGAPDFNTGNYHPFNDLVADMSKLVFEAWAA